ncbi:hypothetical protein P8936_16050 [Edaphobacter paludis]|uniref:Uncharacterized protein n=1 Tax=Edaphobacter paludis TaxID=3035702 RepID=A0AAU7D730_9BACT
MLTLPDAPGAVLGGSVDAAANYSTSADASFDPTSAQQKAGQRRMASRLDSIILPTEQAPSLTAKDKFLMGARGMVTPFAIAGWFSAAGYSHLTNGPPNFGTDRGAFGQRLGAAAILDSTEDFLSTSVMAPVFHEDPRYYQMGRGHSIGRRVVYAATRVLITKTDSGKATPNLSLILGNLEGAALSNAYYPTLNHGASQTLKIFGGSLGGSALGFGVSEFLNDALQLAHLKKSE